MSETLTPLHSWFLLNQQFPTTVERNCLKYQSKTVHLVFSMQLHYTLTECRPTADITAARDFFLVRMMKRPMEVLSIHHCQFFSDNRTRRDMAPLRRTSTVLAQSLVETSRRKAKSLIRQGRERCVFAQFAHFDFLRFVFQIWYILFSKQVHVDFFALDMLCVLVCLTPHWKGIHAQTPKDIHVKTQLMRPSILQRNSSSSSSKCCR